MGITALPRHDVADRDHPRWRERLNSVGCAQTEVEVAIFDAGGRQVQQRFAINERLNSGEVASVNTGMGPYQQQSPCPAEVVAARVAE